MRSLFAASLVASALALAACGGGGASSSPPPAAPAFDIVFDGVDASGVRLLYRVALDGAPVRIGAGYAGNRPNARPDGRAIVYSTIPTDTEPSQLMLIDDVARPATALSPAGIGEREPMWSPDGTRLAFFSQRDDADGDVFVATVANRRLENVRNLTPRGPNEPAVSPDLTPSWSPDGTRLAFTSYRGGSAALWVMNADGTNLRQLTPTSSTHGDYFPTWSPDGLRIAFQRINLTDARIGIVPAGGGNVGLYEFAGKAYAPAWSPDGRWIAFSGLVGDELDIHVREADGTLVRRLARTGDDFSPAWIRRVPG